MSIDDEASFDEQTTNYKLYPNPANNILTVELNIEQGSNLEVRFFNILGEQVLIKKENNLSSNKFTLNISHLAKGVYSVVAIANGEYFSQKLIVE